MTVILNSKLPGDLTDDKALPGVRPLADGQWLRVSDSYAGQIGYRRQLIEQQRDAVLWQQPSATPAVQEVLDTALEAMPGIGFEVMPNGIRCPDGVTINKITDAPLVVLGQTLQEDICILEKRGDAHVLTAALLCFPASWLLSEKAGHPLERIHAPVDEYNEDIARRVNRLFDGVQVGRPLWRNNMIWYDDPDLFQPRSEMAGERKAPTPQKAAYQRVERQTIMRLPKTKAVVFLIHSYIVRANEPS
ncbi:MAG: DUF3445 domain-containing protein [Roseobacter sp.]